jgi:hypothetical protein
VEGNSVTFRIFTRTHEVNAKECILPPSISRLAVVTIPVATSPMMGVRDVMWVRIHSAHWRDSLSTQNSSAMPHSLFGWPHVPAYKGTELGKTLYRRGFFLLFFLPSAAAKNSLSHEALSTMMSWEDCWSSWIWVTGRRRILHNEKLLLRVL